MFALIIQTQLYLVAAQAELGKVTTLNTDIALRARSGSPSDSVCIVNSCKTHPVVHSSCSAVCSLALLSAAVAVARMVSTTSRPHTDRSIFTGKSHMVQPTS